MQPLIIDLSKACRLPLHEIDAMIQSNDGDVIVIVPGSSFTSSGCYEDIAIEWLQASYVGEVLAEISSQADCTLDEDEKGIQAVRFRFRPADRRAFAKRLDEAAQGYDPDREDDFGYMNFMSDVEDFRGTLDSRNLRFPELAENYRINHSPLDDGDNPDEE